MYEAIYHVGKLLTSLSTPIAFALIVLLYNAVSPRRRYARSASLTAAALLLIFGTGQGSHALLGTLEDRYKRIQVPNAEAIVILGGGIVNRTQLGSHADRLWTAAQLYRTNHAPLILIAGGSWSVPPESALAARILLAWGIPPTAILTDQTSLDTHQNATNSYRILTARNIHDILLVTSAIHMPRAAAAFRKTGLTVHEAPADFLTLDPLELPVNALIPSAGALNDSAAALKEWLGLETYRLRGWAQ